MNRTHRVVRASFYLSLALPFAALACGDSFTAGPGDGGEDGGGIIFGDGGPGHDATTSGDGSADATHDGPQDGPRDAGVGHDATAADGMAETGTTDGPSCGPGMLTCADGGCVPESPTNCGSCGNDCTVLPHVMGAQCNAGQCSYTCAPGWQNCTSTQGVGCPTNITQQGNCGACNVTCSGNTPLCSGTGCVSGCDAGEMICNGSCVNTGTDPQNCSMCGVVCPNDGPPNSQPTCSGGMCSWACDQPNYQQCTLSSGTSCIGTVADTTHGLFVDPSGQPTSCGSAAVPCSSVSAALPYLINGKNIIYVAEATYTEQVTLPAGVTIQGNWVDIGGQWTHDCALPKTTIQAPAGSNRVITVSYSSGSSTLDSLILTNATTAGTGVSQYGIFASSSGTTAGALVLTNVSITVAAGGGGADGGAGGDGGAPPASCSAGTPPLQNGSPGNPGTGAGAGNYGQGGYSPSTTGTAGTTGGNGSNGSAAPACGQPNGPQSVQAWNVVNNDYTSNATCCVQNSGAGTTCVACGGSSQQICAGVGTPGCGSTGSGGGAPGTGGGASIGLFVWNETVTVSGSGITTAGGGTGGNGGPGGQVYPGSAGSPGASSTQLVSTACSQQTLGGNPACVASYKALDGGSKGGTGYSGGTGGQGGGGNGGDSYCWYAGGGGTVSADTFTNANCSPGPGGLGGNQGGGTSQGTKGASGTHN